MVTLNGIESNEMTPKAMIVTVDWCGSGGSFPSS